MPLFKRKARTVEARVYEGPRLTVVSHEKGSQTANNGDYLIGTERFKVTVMTAAQFEHDYEPITEDLITEEQKVPHFDSMEEALFYLKANLTAEEFQFTVGDDQILHSA